ncbi:VWA domain-containing protein [Nonomuraea sp. NPDC048916]|uniref:vWA domain-containing protein n=1 Tax=Nonomuraea sp. NPDC048916 TaxID=3154232 RepID=UPI0033EE6610
MSGSRPTRPAMLPGVDRAAFAASLAVRLRQRGVPVGLTGVEDFVRALDVAQPRSLPELYWAARISLVRRHSEIEIFDEAFAAIFDSVGPALDPHARRRPLARTNGSDDAFVPLPDARAGGDDAGGLPWTTLPAVVAGAEGPDGSTAVPELLPSDAEGLADVPFEELGDRECELLGRWLEEAAADWPTRRARRFRVSPRGRAIAVRATLARSRRTGWEPFRLARKRPVVRSRRVVMLCDVSQSMQAQASAYLHLMRALAVTVDAEVFAFATTLTRLTPVLAHRSAAAAVGLATERVTDRFGGTRIATNVRALLASHHGAKVRGAIVLVGSDGWDGDPPEELGAAMDRLSRRAHRVIWMNPRAAAPGFEPRVASMAAALPYCDLMLPAHTFGSLRDVIGAVGGVAGSRFRW